uniref:receptor protein serine/threonine kinase n=1 Tax=Meloidogyne hapla TaxID=6305 RepID=A0A1I8BSL0_MELHA
MIDGLELVVNEWLEIKWIIFSLKIMNKNISLDIRKYCFCNYDEPQKCDYERTCIKEFNEQTRTFELKHLFGCAPLEKGSNGSHLTCNAWRFTHSSPKSISCCYEGDYCNKHLSIPSFPLLERPTKQIESFSSFYSLEFFIFAFFGFLIGLFLIIIVTLPLHKYIRKKGKLIRRQLNSKINKKLKDEEEIINLSKNKENSQSFFEDSGSGAGRIILNKRRIALDLQMQEIFSKGRYGELCKAIYRGSFVAVKIFNSTEEESWRNERDIYLSQMLNHENILQYIAADILSNVDSLTQMLLITDFHPLGSLYDYLCSKYSLNLEEALNLSLSAITGLEHLHNPVRGTGERQKPEIAHRDIKSKNILVKRPGVCCIADFGLAIAKNENLIKNNFLNIQVGTKRYMAPEILNKTLNPNNFEEFKCADIYSFSLVLWEIINCIELKTNNLKQNNYLNNCQSTNSSGVVSGGTTSFVNNTSQSFEIKTNSFQNNTSTTTSLISENEINNLNIFNNNLKERKGQHKLPFELIVETDPSFDQMREIVCEKKIRPPILNEWIDKKEENLIIICNLMVECWSNWPRSRHKALKIKKEIAKIIKNFDD